MSRLLTIAEAIEQSDLGTAIAEGRYAFPIIEGIHLIGLSVAVGLIFLVDLRLMGIFLPSVPVRDLHRQLQPYVFAGFALIMVAGLLEFVIARRPNAMNERGPLPRGVRLAGLASLSLWVLVIVCGRLIPYIPRWT
jgi:hypothetical protein